MFPQPNPLAILFNSLYLKTDFRVKNYQITGPLEMLFSKSHYLQVCFCPEAASYTYILYVSMHFDISNVISMGRKKLEILEQRGTKPRNKLLYQKTTYLLLQLNL